MNSSRVMTVDGNAVRAHPPGLAVIKSPGRCDIDCDVPAPVYGPVNGLPLDIEICKCTITNKSAGDDRPAHRARRHQMTTIEPQRTRRTARNAAPTCSTAWRIRDLRAARRLDREHRRAGGISQPTCCGCSVRSALSRASDNARADRRLAARNHRARDDAAGESWLGEHSGLWNGPGAAAFLQAYAAATEVRRRARRGCGCSTGCMVTGATPERTSSRTHADHGRRLDRRAAGMGRRGRALLLADGTEMTSGFRRSGDVRSGAAPGGHRPSGAGVARASAVRWGRVISGQCRLSFPVVPRRRRRGGSLAVP